MKRYTAFLPMLLLIFSLLIMTGCNMLQPSGSSGVHTSSYEPITGKFYLYRAADERISSPDTYFDIDGTEGSFSLKYYENGVLKKEGELNKVVTKSDRLGYMTDNLHFNLKCGESYEHIGAYTESFDPVNQFRIIDEYSGGRVEKKYYYSELPFILGTYLREGAEYAEESANKNATDYRKPTLDDYTSELNGKYQLDDEHYFYFISPDGYVLKDGPYMDSYFQYYAPGLDKPIEGFAHGITYKDSYAPPRIYFTFSQNSSYYESLEDNESKLMFGYSTFTEDFTMIDHYGSIDFENGSLNSFTFEHLSRSWTEAEWDEFTKNESYRLPDAIIYEFIGGTYEKAGDR